MGRNDVNNSFVNRGDTSLRYALDGSLANNVRSENIERVENGRERKEVVKR